VKIHDVLIGQRVDRWVFRHPQLQWRGKTRWQTLDWGRFDGNRWERLPRNRWWFAWERRSGLDKDQSFGPQPPVLLPGCEVGQRTQSLLLSAIGRRAGYFCALEYFAAATTNLLVCSP